MRMNALIEIDPLSDFEARLPALRPRLHRYCASMTGSVIDGEDVLQEALAKAHSALTRGAVVDDLEHWLFRIAHNAAYDHLRRRKRDRAMLAEDIDIDQMEDFAMSAEGRQSAAESLRTLMHLPLAQRSAVILVDVLGLTLAETCDVVDATLAATKAALHRGRARLAELAGQVEDVAAPTLDADEERRLRHYIDRFNARDFDAIRALIAEDVQLELVNGKRMNGKREVSSYFTNYDRVQDWELSLGFIDGRPAILSRVPGTPESEPVSFMLIDWRGDEVSAIRDFRYAGYVMATALVQHVDAARG
jgi:RNA polymerase sigma-70 factor (ECF subfamily)